MIVIHILDTQIKRSFAVMKGYTSFIWVYQKTRNHKVKVRKQQDVEKIKGKVKRVTYHYKSPITDKFQITLEFKSNPDSDKIKQEVKEILKGEFLKNFIESSGQSRDLALSSPPHLDKEETRE